MFVDVAEDKIARGAYNHGTTGLKPVPVLHFSKVQLPVVCANHRLQSKSPGN
jgi:hypothetical protein